MDYYKVLEITEQADEDQIRQAYRKLAKKYHPDINPGNPEAEEKFKDIVEAYEVLGDATKRKAYDEKRSAASGYGGKRNGQKQGQGSYTRADVNMADFTKNMEKYFGFSFGGGKTEGKQQETRKEKKNPLDVTEMFEAFMKIK